MKIFILIISHALAFGLGCYSNLKLVEWWVNTNVEFEKASKRLKELNDDE